MQKQNKKQNKTKKKQNMIVDLLHLGIIWLLTIVINSMINH